MFLIYFEEGKVAEVMMCVPKLAAKNSVHILKPAS